MRLTAGGATAKPLHRQAPWRPVDRRDGLPEVSALERVSIGLSRDARRLPLGDGQQAETVMTAPILVIGGSTGIGAALARRLSAGGMAVHVMARAGERLDAIARELGCPASPVDARDPDALGAAVAAASAGGLSGLAYCVGSIVLKPLAQVTAAEMAQVFALNTIAPAMAVKAATGNLAAGSGVVLFSTVAARQGFANHVAIAAAKSGVEGLTLSLAAELAPRLRVNCIAPSLTRTPLAAKLTANETMAKAIAALHPIPRLGEPEDAAALAAFLLSSQAGWITGQVIGVDGGRSTLRTKG
jgi:NAD(P)-dependent dehydrogenase (short-subunit alcohol dehydrogenase family)